MQVINLRVLWVLYGDLYWEPGQYKETCRNYVIEFQQIVDRRGITAFDNSLVDAIRIECRAKGNKNSTVNRKLACLGKLLRKYQRDGHIDRRQFNTAKRSIYPYQRIRKTTLKILYDVWNACKDRSQPDWYGVGERLRLSPAYVIEKDDDERTIAHKKRMMSLCVQRYHRKAIAIIDFAAKGDFPRMK